MAYPSRERVFAALFAQLQTLNQFVTVTRLAVLPDYITTNNSPLLSLLEGNGRTTYNGHRLDKEEWDAFIVIYFKKADKTQPGSSTINPLIDAVRDLLQPNDLQQNVYVLKDLTTGVKLVSWLRVEGTTVVENGDTATDGVGGALIPLRMLIP